MNQLKWGIIGPGNIATSFIADMALVTESSNSAVAVMSNDMEEAAQFAAAYSIPQYFNNVKEMLENAPVEVVYVASPHSAHFKESITCLQRNVPVLCEKPMALNVKQAEEMIAAARKHHTFLMEGMWIRFLPSIQVVLKLLEQGIIGKVESIIANMSYVAPKESDNRFYNPELGGGSLLDLGIYPVYLSLLILGIPDIISASARLSPEGIDENCHVVFNYPDKSFALLESSIIRDTSRQAHIYGGKGDITILKQWNERPESVVVSLYDGTTREYPCNWEGRGFQFEIAEVVRCLSANQIESDLHSHPDSLKLISTLDKIRETANIVYSMYE